MYNVKNCSTHFCIPDTKLGQPFFELLRLLMNLLEKIIFVQQKSKIKILCNLLIQKIGNQIE